MGYYDNYLEHHGILGQKWGVRRYQNDDGSLTALGRQRYGSLEKSKEKYANAKGWLAKTYHNYNMTEKEYELERANRVKKAKGLGNKFSEAYGYKDLEKHAKAKSERWERNATFQKSQRMKTNMEANAYNAKQLEKYAKTMQNKSGAERFIESGLVKTELMKMPWKSASGRDTTYGKEVLLYATTAGIGNLVLDSKYRKESGKVAAEKQAREDYKDAVSKAKSEWKESAKKYASDDSEKGNKMYEDAADKYNEDIRKAKEKYKYNMRQ